MAEENVQKMIGQRFRQFRKDKNITQDDLKDIANNIVISRIENGHRMPNPEILMHMANRYGMDINWLLTGESVKKSASSNSEILARLGMVEVRIRELEKELGKELFK